MLVQMYQTPLEGPAVIQWAGTSPLCARGRDEDEDDTRSDSCTSHAKGWMFCVHWPCSYYFMFFLNIVALH